MALSKEFQQPLGTASMPATQPRAAESQCRSTCANQRRISKRPLRVCPETSCGIAEPSQHEADGSETQEGERLAVEVLPILRQSAASSEPSKGALHDPALGQDDKPFSLIRAFHDLEADGPQDLLERALELRTLVAGIGIELHQERIQTEQRREQPDAPVPVLDIASVHDRMHQEAFRVDEYVALLALDLLARIIAADSDACRPPFPR